MKDNKHIREMVMKHAGEQQDKKRRQELDELEINQIRQLIEKDHSPLRFIEEVSEEVKVKNEK